MRRILCFFRALNFSGKLQYGLWLLILGFNFWQSDLNPGNRLFGLPLWMITAPMYLLMILIARALLPVMMARPQKAQQILQGFGLLLFGFWLFSRGQAWGRSFLAFFGISCGFWLETAASFWFISECQQRMEATMAGMSEGQDQFSDADHDEDEYDTRDNRGYRR